MLKSHFINKLNFKSDNEEFPPLAKKDWRNVYTQCRSKHRYNQGEGFGYLVKCRKYKLMCCEDNCPDLKEIRRLTKCKNK